MGFFSFTHNRRAISAFEKLHTEDLTYTAHCYVNNILPAELPRVIHVGTRLDVAFVRVIDSGGSSVSSTQDEYKTV